MSGNARPLSPHLQVYRPQLTSLTSIMHRLSGLSLCAAALLLVWWLVALAAGEAAYRIFQDCLVSLPGKLAVAFIVLALCYHFFNGIRHLLWDTGWGLDLKRAYATGWAVLGLTPLTAALVLWSVWS